MSRKKKRITPFKEFESVEENATSYIRNGWDTIKVYE